MTTEKQSTISARLDAPTDASTMFTDQRFVTYDGGPRPVSTLVFDSMNDGFLFGQKSPHSRARGSAPWILRTQTAAFICDTVVVARTDPEMQTVTAAYDVSDFDGVSGRIGERTKLPGSEEPEVVTAIEIAYGPPFGTHIVHEPSPFAGKMPLLERALGMVDHDARRTRMLGKIAQD